MEAQMERIEKLIHGNGRSFMRKLIDAQAKKEIREGRLLCLQLLENGANDEIFEQLGWAYEYESDGENADMCWDIADSLYRRNKIKARRAGKN